MWSYTSGSSTPTSLLPGMDCTHTSVRHAKRIDSWAHTKRRGHDRASSGCATPSQACLLAWHTARAPAEVAHGASAGRWMRVDARHKWVYTSSLFLMAVASATSPLHLPARSHDQAYPCALRRRDVDGWETMPCCTRYGRSPML